MSPERASPPRLDRQTIKAKQAALSEMDRALTARLAAMFQSGGVGASAPIQASEHDRRVRAEAKELLNGAGHLLEEPSERATEAQVYAQRQAVRLALDALLKADGELEAQEHAAWIEAHADEWRAVIRDWVLAAQHFVHAEQAARRFKERAPGSFGGWFWVGFAGIDPVIGTIYTPSLSDLIDAAAAQGIVSASDLKKAARVEGRS